MADNRDACAGCTISFRECLYLSLNLIPTEVPEKGVLCIFNGMLVRRTPVNKSPKRPVVKETASTARPLPPNVLSVSVSAPAENLSAQNFDLMGGSDRLVPRS